MNTEAKMNQVISIRLSNEDESAVREIKEQTGSTIGQVVRIGLKHTIAQFKRDGFLKLESTEPSAPNKKP